MEGEAVDGEAVDGEAGEDAGAVGAAAGVGTVLGELLADPAVPAAELGATVSAGVRPASAARGSGVALDGVGEGVSALAGPATSASQAAKAIAASFPVRARIRTG